MSHEVPHLKQPFWEDQGEFIPFSRPSLSDEAIQEVVSCLRSGWITTGPAMRWPMQCDEERICSRP